MIESKKYPKHLLIRGKVFPYFGSFLPNKKINVYKTFPKLEDLWLDILRVLIICDQSTYLIHFRDF